MCARVHLLASPALSCVYALGAPGLLLPDRAR